MMKWQLLGARTALALAAVAALGAAVPAAAQMGFDGEAFVKAVRDKDGGKALELLKARSTSVINARDSRGDTALTVALARRDETWTIYLLQEGADPSLPNGKGDTPLIVATRAGYQLAAEWLLSAKAKVDAPNRSGETALIVAVQQRQPGMVKLLLAAGADPDRVDSVAGYSARDYARRDNRNPQLLRLIDAARPPRKTL